MAIVLVKMSKNYFEIKMSKYILWQIHSKNVNKLCKNIKIKKNRNPFLLEFDIIILQIKLLKWKLENSFFSLFL